MDRNFTRSDIIKYLYAELDEESSIAILEWILSDEKRTQHFEDIAESKNLLGNESFSPRNSSIHRILSFSENLALEAHR